MTHNTTHIITIQSYYRRYIRRKQYVRLYNATFRIQNFILHRIDNVLLLENIKYLSNFAKSKDKASFIQKKNKCVLDETTAKHEKDMQTLELYIKKLKSMLHEEQIQNSILREKNNSIMNRVRMLQDEHTTIHNQLMIEKETNTMAQSENETNRNNYRSTQLQLDHIIKELHTYTEECIQAQHTNQSLKDMNIGLCTKLGNTYISLANTQEELHKHRGKTVWDILFKRIN